MERNVGVLVVAVGAVVVLVGLLIWSGALSWFGRLPGDIRLDGGRGRLFVPVTSMLLVSVVVSLVLTVAGRWLR